MDLSTLRSNLLEEQNAISSDGDHWKSFLQFSSRMNRYDFTEQVLIHFSKPDAYACASMEAWNNLFGRWVNRGAKGIPLLRVDSNGNYKVFYVFDYSDTHKSLHNIKDINWFTYSDIHRDGLISFAKEYGFKEDDLAKTMDEQIVFLLADKISEIHYTQLIDSLIDESSQTDKSALSDLLSASVSFSVLHRIGFIPDQLFDYSIFDDISNYQGNDLLALLGNTISACVTEFIVGLQDKINIINKPLAKEQETNDKDTTSNNPEQDDLQNPKRPLLSFEEDIQHGEKGDGIQSDRRNSLSGDRTSDIPDRSEPVRQSQTEILTGGEEKSILSDADERNTDGSFEGNGHEVPGLHDDADPDHGRTERLDHRDERQEFSGVHPADEQHQELPERDNIQHVHFPVDAEKNNEDTVTGAATAAPVSFEIKLAADVASFFWTYAHEDVLDNSNGAENPEIDLFNSYLSAFETRDVTKLNDLIIDLSAYQNVFSPDTESKEASHLIYLINAVSGYLPDSEKNEAQVSEPVSSNTEAVKPQVVSSAPSLTKDDISHIPAGTKIHLNGSEWLFDKLENDYVSLHMEAFPLINSKLTTDEFIVRFDADQLNLQILNTIKSNDFFLDNSDFQEIEQLSLTDISDPLTTIPSGRSVISATGNYVIHDKNLGFWSNKDKVQFNLNAIRTLKQIENEVRAATADEQDVLAKYVGWGGLPEVFDAQSSAFPDAYSELKQLLTKEEYDSARSSTLSAHFTQPVIIDAVYNALNKFGFKSGLILEPASGVGNFFGRLPAQMKSSSLYGVELDSISARISKLLYPEAVIEEGAFEDSSYPHNFFDVVIGNVPFGEYRIKDSRYSKYAFMIHDYFFARSIDLVRPGGFIIFVTSKGTLDKKDPKIRQYLAERSDLIGAIRLPNNAFKANAGTSVTSDIIILQKRDVIRSEMPYWVNTKELSPGITINDYFIENPNMVLGNMALVSGPYGEESACVPLDGADLELQLNAAIQQLSAVYSPAIPSVTASDELSDLNVIPAIPEADNFSFYVVENVLYYRNDSLMLQSDLEGKRLERVLGMVKVRDALRQVIDLQVKDADDNSLSLAQNNLMTEYKNFVEQFGNLSDRSNAALFNDDSSAPLLLALETLDANGNVVGLADIFYERTISAQTPISQVNTSEEALMASLNEFGRIDLNYMIELTGLTSERILSDLQDRIFLDPESGVYVTDDEYLSGDVKRKLQYATNALHNQSLLLKDSTNAEEMKNFNQSIAVLEHNISRLKNVIPEDLEPGDIFVRLGSTWIPVKYYREFMYEVFDISRFKQRFFDISFCYESSTWKLEKSSAAASSYQAKTVYGTEDMDGFAILEDCLNLRPSKVYDSYQDSNGKTKRSINISKTLMVQQKQDALNSEFKDWLWRDSDRRQALLKLYNDKFNSIRNREYDGSHLTFPGMNVEITLTDYQKNAVARALYGGNTLLAHVVGAGKTFEMAAIAMESKRIGLCNKSLFVVPNHLTEQWGKEFLKLYPAAKLLIASKKDFLPARRKRFCAQIATGNYDAVIIGHSQFERIPLSTERQIAGVQQQINDIVESIEKANFLSNKRFTIKQLEKLKKNLQGKLKELNDQSNKDDVVTFEELGIDRLFVDEAHYYKNLYVYTKMQNVSGITTTESKKASDFFLKCQYINDISNYRGLVLATGTPVSNSMCELFTLQRYLQYDRLKQLGLQNFDAWASTFGDVVTAVELAPEGKGWRLKSRFAKFYNLPELMNMFREVSDIKVADQISLKVPKANVITTVAKASNYQMEMIRSLAERADKIRAGQVERDEDNMLLVTHHGRLAALDQRLINPELPMAEGGKINLCAKQVFKLWRDHAEDKAAQLVFCDISVPQKDGSFSVYSDLKRQLMALGIPEKEVRFIHEAKNEIQKEALFEKVRAGQVRVLIGSTQLMGAGTNVQNRLIASHDLDCPWRPSDLEQRMGRIVRQGNLFDQVYVYRYVTENTFDAYMYQLVETKQRFISQIMTSKTPVRAAEDVDECVLSYAEIKALAVGDPLIKEKLNLEIELNRLNLLKKSFLSQRADLDRIINIKLPQQITALNKKISCFEKDIQIVNSNSISAEDKGFYKMVIGGETYNNKADAGDAILQAKQKINSKKTVIGNYRGLEMAIYYEPSSNQLMMSLKGNWSHSLVLGDSNIGNITRINNVINGFNHNLAQMRLELDSLYKSLQSAEVDIKKEWPLEQEMRKKSARLTEVNSILEFKNSSEIHLDR